MTVGVYGLGRFGRLWAELLSNSCSVVAYDRFHRLSIPQVTPVAEEDLLKTDALFLTVAISAIDEVCQRLAAMIARHREAAPLILDCCSVKIKPLEAMQRRFQTAVEILGTHPMFGPDSLHDLHHLPYPAEQNLKIVLCKGRISPQKMQLWRHQFSSLGMKVVEMTAEEHDCEAACTQGLTHLIGRILQNLHLRNTIMATNGYCRLQDLVTQTGNDSWQLFYDLHNYNPYSEEMRQNLLKSFNEICYLLNHEKTGKGDDRNTRTFN